MEPDDEYTGPYTCIRCLEGTSNDCDICDYCLVESEVDDPSNG
jgi:hypothetical protein